MEKYKDKLLEEKIDSMNQLDRIEFDLIENRKRHIITMGSTGSLISLSSGIILFVLGYFIMLLDSPKFITVEIFSILFSFVFIGFSLLIIFTTEKSEKKYDKKLTKFIEEKSKK